MTESAPRVGIYGYFGMGNIGNEGSLTAFLADLRRRHPLVSVSCFVADAQAVADDHGVPATQLMYHRATPGAAKAGEMARKIVGRVLDVPRTWHLMGDVDVLVVPGTGVLETQLMARPWGLPYWLFVATLSCRLRGRRVALVSVGAEPSRHAGTRLLFRWTVRLASWPSVRDEGSRRVLRSWGMRQPIRVTPDLAFALPVPDGGPVRPGHVVIGVMAYQGDPADPERGPHVVLGYANRMAEVVSQLAEAGRSVAMVVGDVADLALARDIRATAVQRTPAARDLVTVSRATTLAGLMTEMAQAEVAVVSRFHNLVCALKLTRPTVSLSYAGKSARLLQEFGLGEFVQPMESFDVDLLLQQIDRSVEQQPSLELVMKGVLRRYEDDLADQFRQLGDEVIAPVPNRRKRPRRPRRGGFLPPDR
jgi:polysaccharide pyruvyl transferase WcaK-like protein